MTKSIRNYWPIIFAAFAVMALLLFLWWPSISQTFKNSDDERVYRIGYQQTALYRHLFLAKELDLFDSEGVRVELVQFRSANDMMTAMLAGDLDVLGLTNMEVALRVAEEDPGQFVLVNFLVWGEDATPDYILDCDEERDLDSVDDLVGLTLGRHPGTAVRAFSEEVLETSGAPLDQVRQEELAPGLMREAVAGGRVDALYAMDPIASQLVDEGMCEVMVEHPLGTIVSGPIPIAGTAISTKLINDNPDAADAITRALDRSIILQRGSAMDREAAEAIAAYTQIDAELALRLNDSEYWTSSEMQPQQVQRIIDRFQVLGVSKTAVPVRQLISQ